MSFEEEFDRIIRQKVEGADFPFDEKNWERARRLLDGERESGLAGMGFMTKAAIVSVAGLLLSGAGWLWWRSENPAAEKQIAQTSAASPARIAAATRTDAAGLPAGEESKVIAAPDPVAPKYPATASSEARQAEMSPLEASSVATSASPAHNNSATSRGNHDAATVQPDQVYAGPSLAGGIVHDAGSNDKQVAESSNKRPVIEPDMTAPSSGALPEAAIPGTDLGVHNNIAEQLALVVPQMPEAQEPEIRNGAVQLLNYFDDDYYRPEKYRKHYLNLEAGGSYLYGWAVESGRDGRGLNWFGGANYGIYLGKHSDLSLGLQAYNIGNMSKPFFDHSRTDFGFSSVTTRTTIAVNNLFYLAVPVRYTYAIDAQNSLGVSFNAGLLMSSRNVMTTSFSSDIKTETQETKTKGYYEGMNPTNLQLGAFYKARLGDRLYVNGELTWAPLNVFKYTESKVNTANNFGLRLSLQYTLFDK